MKHFLFLICFFISPSIFSCELKIAIRDAVLYSSQDENGKWQGSDVDIYRYLADAISCDIKYVVVPFADAVKLLKTGEIDAMTQLSILPDRIKDISFVGPVRRESFALVTSKHVKETIHSFDDIANLPYVFAKRKGTYLGRDFHKKYVEDNQFSSKFIELSTVNPRINLILKKRIYGFFDESIFIRHALTYLPEYQGLKMHPITIDNGDVFIGFSKKSLDKKTIEKLSKAFNTLKKKDKALNYF